MKIQYIPILVISIILWHGPAPRAATSYPPLTDAIQYLYRLAQTPTLEPKKAPIFQTDRISELLDIISAPKSAPIDASPAVDGTFAYHAFTIDCDLTAILDYAYSPNIPAYALTPSSVRLCYWQPLENGPSMSAELKRLKRSAQHPIVVKGVEHVEITPDISTGAYYRYQENRTLIRFDANDQHILISLSKQRNRSDVGRQGYVVGNDSNWNYLYSPEKGLSLAGLGWIKAYMYNSFSIMMFSQPISATGPVTCRIFKWLDAGWANFNMVKPKHIMRGIKRYAKDFKAIIEAPDLPPVDQMADYMARFNQLSQKELEAAVSRHFDALAQYCRQNGNQKILDRVLNQDYLNTLDRKQMEAVLVVEFIKCMLGKAPGGIPCAELAPAEIYPTRQDATPTTHRSG